MRAKQVLQKRKQEQIERVKATHRAADTVIATHFAKELEQLAPYGRLTVAYALMMLGYNTLRQYLQPPKAEQNFAFWGAFAMNDKKTASMVAAVAEDYRVLADPARFQHMRRSSHDIILKHFSKRQTLGCSTTDAAYALIVLAYKLIRQDQPETAAKKIFTLLTPFAIKEVDAARARRAKLH